MGWCSATDIIDAAIAGAERAVAEAWQVASGADGARTPAYANALNAQPELRDRIDSILRPFVAKIAEKLREQDWDCTDESNYFDRFPQELTGWTDAEYGAWLAEQITEDPLNAGKHTDALHALQMKG